MFSELHNRKVWGFRFGAPGELNDRGDKRRDNRGVDRGDNRVGDRGDDRGDNRGDNRGNNRGEFPWILVSIMLSSRGSFRSHYLIEDSATP